MLPVMARGAYAATAAMNGKEHCARDIRTA